MLIPEDAVHEEIKRKLEEIDWINGNEEFGIKEKATIDYILWNVLKERIQEINKSLFLSLTEEQEEKAFEIIKSELEIADEVRMLEYLKHGITINVRGRNDRIILIDYENPENNVFFYLHEARFSGFPQNVEPDFMLFVNGIPVAIIEAKPTDVVGSENEALNQIRRYEIYSPELFRFVQLAVAYGNRKLYTPTYPNFERTERHTPAFSWKVNGRDEIFDLLTPSRFLEVLRYFTFFFKKQEKGAKRIKVIARWNQYRAVKRIIERIENYINGRDCKNKGLIWHWQGSGKTFIMFFVANYFLTNHKDKAPVVFFVVDRENLETQHAGVFKSVEDVEFTSYFKVIRNIDELKERVSEIIKSLETGNIIPTGLYITTIQKFQLKKFQDFVEEIDGRIVPKKVVDKKEVLFLIDEAHRTQYGKLASVMRAIFQNAMFFGFTGTPIFKKYKNTFQEFAHPEDGEYYLDVYFIRESTEDGFTIPIVHEVVEEKGITLTLDEESIKAFIDAYARYDPEDVEAFLQGRKKSLKLSSKELTEKLKKAKVFLESEERIQKFADYIAQRIYEDTAGFTFKAMVVAVNRLACVKFKKALDKAFKLFFCSKAEELERLGQKEKAKAFRELCENAEKLSEVVMTYGHNDPHEIEEYKRILKERFPKKDLRSIINKFVDDFVEQEYPKVLIVTDMLLTGFDAPILRVMYLDKPLFEHRLLQAVARVNRPYEGKKDGLVVDSIGLLKALLRVINIYEMIATYDDNIIADFKRYFAKSVEEKVREFEESLELTKKELKELRISVNLIMELQSANRIEELSKELNRVINVIGELALKYKAHDRDAVKLFNDIYDLIQLYRSLGSHPARLKYLKEMEIISWIYSNFSKLLGRGRRRSKFWEELLKFIHQNMNVEPFQRVIRIKIDPSLISESIGFEVATHFYKIYYEADENAHNPIYKAILERLNKLLKEWLNRNIDLKTFKQELESLERELEKYKKAISGKSREEKIIESIRFYINKHLDAQINNFENLKRELRRVRRVTPRLKKRLAEALFLDLTMSLDRDRTVISDIVDFLVETYIIPEVMRFEKSGDGASGSA